MHPKAVGRDTMEQARVGSKAMLVRTSGLGTTGRMI